jgi:hypothetical protein
LAVDIENATRNINVTIGCYFLHDQIHWEQRREVVWTYWLQGSWMKWRWWWSWKIRDDVVPLGWHLIFSQQELMLLD